MRALAVGLLSLAILQDQRVALVPSFELARSRHGVVVDEAIDATKVLWIDADGAIRAAGRLLVPALVVSSPESELVAPLYAWMLELVRSMPIDPQDPLAQADPGSAEAERAVRMGVLRIEAHRDAPAERALRDFSATPARAPSPRRCGHRGT